VTSQKTPPRFFIAPSCIDQESGQARCDEPGLSHQVRNVLRLKEGDPVQLLDGLGHIWQAKLVSAGRTFIEFCFETESLDRTDSDQTAKAKEVEGREHFPAFRLVSCLPLIKAQRFEWCLEKLCELGASTIIPFQSERCVVKLKASEAGRSKRWQSICREASEQCERLFLPELLEPISLEDLLQNHCGPGRQRERGGLTGGSSAATSSASGTSAGDWSGRLKLLLSERNDKAPDMVSTLYNRQACASSATGPLPATCDLYVLAGPEGGFSREELQLIGDYGFANVSLGDLILRSETASILAAGVVSVVNARKTKEN
jgi:16S rRNA (uracil1498-N3)-methyltransferase